MENIKREGRTFINKDIIKLDGNDKLEKIIYYAEIVSWRRDNVEYKDIEDRYISDITYKQLEERIEIKADKIMVSLLKEASFITAHNTYMSDKKIRYVYTFTKPDNFFEVDNCFFQDINKANSKLKAFVLLLKSICLNGTNFYISKKPISNSINKSELCKQTGLSMNSLKKYLQMAIDNNDIALIENGLIITNEFIKADTHKDSLYKFLYDAIYKHCASKGILPPKYEDRPLRYLSMYYPFDETAYNNYKDIVSNADNVYLPSVLIKRLSNMPKSINWQYLLKALTEFEESKQDNNTIIL